MKVLVHELDVSNSVIDLSVSLATGEGQSSCQAKLLDYDGKIKEYLTARTIEIKGIVGVPKPKPVPITIAVSAGVSATGEASPGGSAPISGSAPAGYSVGSGGVPSYPQPQNVKDRILGIVRECLRQGVTDIGQIAYVLATVKGECGSGGYGGGLPGGYSPVKEVGASGARYAPWVGRGLIQVTWKYNYEKVKAASGRDVIANPDLLITDFGLSCWAIVWGMKGGIYTGKKLSDYISGGSRDFTGARRIVNGTDKASLFAGYANQWVRDLPPYIQAASGSAPVSVPASAPKPSPAPTPSPTASPSPTATNPTTPTATAPVTPAPAPAEPVPEGDKLEIEFEGEEWSFIYSGFTAGLDGTLTVSGMGARKAADAAVALPTSIPSASVDDVAKAVGDTTGKKVEIIGKPAPKKEEIVVGKLTPSQLLAKEAASAGKVVTDDGSKITVKDKPTTTPPPAVKPPTLTGTTAAVEPVTPTDVHDVQNVIEFTHSDKPVGELTIISGNNVRGFPSSLVIPLATGIKAGDGVNSPILVPSGRDWIIDKLTHSLTAGVTQMDVYSEFEANSALVQQPQAPIQFAMPAITPITGTPSAPGTATAPNPNASAAIQAASGSLAKMLAAALAARGQSSSMGPSGGRLACAYMVNKVVLKPALGRTYGENTNLVTSVIGAMKSEGWADVSASQAPPGAICAAWNGSGGHVGIIIRSGSDPMSLSNSSSRAAWVSEYGWVSQMNKTYRGCEFHFMVTNK